MKDKKFFLIKIFFFVVTALMILWISYYIKSLSKCLEEDKKQYQIMVQKVNSKVMTKEESCQESRLVIDDLKICVETAGNEKFFPSFLEKYIQKIIGIEKHIVEAEKLHKETCS